MVLKMYAPIFTKTLEMNKFRLDVGTVTVT